MRSLTTCGVGKALLVGLVGLTLPAVGHARDPGDRPNVVVIYADDMGYGDLSCYGNDDVVTPRIDRMAGEGVRFTAFYNSSSACSTSRAALLTGCYHQRVSVRTVFPPGSNEGLNPDEITIADMLKARGYATACIGKWHLGYQPALMPGAQGFDYFYGVPVVPSNPPLHYPNGIPLYENEQVILEGLPIGEYTGRLTDKTLEFIETHADGPFFVYLAHPMPHVPLGVTERFEGAREQRGLYGDVLAELDHNVGRVLDKLNELDLAHNTLVVFLSDNGPWLVYGNHGGSTGDLRGEKRNTFEGGVRTPCIAWWPGRAKQGAVCDVPAATIDLLPTIAALSGADVPSDRVIDGINIASLFLASGDHPPVDPKRPLIFYHYGANELFSLRSGRWKLHLPHRYQSTSAIGGDGQAGRYALREIDLSLFDLIADPRETTNLVEEHPEVVERLMEIVARYRRDLGDALAGVPPGPDVRPLGKVE